MGVAGGAVNVWAADCVDPARDMRGSAADWSPERQKEIYDEYWQRLSKPITAEELDAAQAHAVGEIDFLKINREFS